MGVLYVSGPRGAMVRTRLQEALKSKVELIPLKEIAAAARKLRLRRVDSGSVVALCKELRCEAVVYSRVVRLKRRIYALKLGVYDGRTGFAAEKTSKPVRSRAALWDLASDSADWLLKQIARTRVPAKQKQEPTPTPTPTPTPEQPTTPPPSENSLTFEDPDDTDSWEVPSVEKAAVANTAAKKSAPSSPVVWRSNALFRAMTDIAHEAKDPGGVPENVLELFGQAILDVRYRPRSWLQLQVAGQLLYRLTMLQTAETGFFGRLNRHQVEPRLQDTFVQLSSKYFDASAGMMTTVWGVTDFVSPNDTLARRDLRNGPLTQLETLRIPSPTVKLEAYVKNITFSAVWLPVWLPDRQDLFGSDYSAFSPGAPPQLAGIGAILASLVDNSREGKLQPSLIQTRAPRPGEGSVAAGRVAFSVSGWDIAAQYAYTFARLPVIRFQNSFVAQLRPLLSKSSLNAADLALLARLVSVSKLAPLDSRYRRMHQAGLAVSTTLWVFVLSLDASYMSKQPIFLGGNLPLKPDGDYFTTAVTSQLVASTIGLRYSRGEAFSAAVEGWWQAQIDIAMMDQSERPQLLLGGPYRGGLAFNARYVWRAADLTFQIFGQFEFHKLGYILVPQISYRFNDHLRFFVGASFLGGERGSTGHLFDPNDQVYMGLQVYL